MDIVQDVYSCQLVRSVRRILPDRTCFSDTRNRELLSSLHTGTLAAPPSLSIIHRFPLLPETLPTD